MNFQIVDLKEGEKKPHNKFPNLHFALESLIWSNTGVYLHEM